MRRLSGSGNVAGGAANIAGRVRGVNAGIMDEKVLELVFRAINWDPQSLCVVARVSRRLRAVAERVLWRQLCLSRAPRMVAALSASPATRVGGGWPALAKLLLFCCGAPAPTSVRGHFAPVSRFSKTSGRSFLSRRCAGDLLYVSDPCEHAAAGGDEEDVVGAYRGVFRGFMRSRTRAFLVGHRAPLEPRVRCPYCGARVWSMTAAGLAPRSACRRLGADEGRLEYFVCVSGHLHGSCWLARLSDSSDAEHDAESDSNNSNSDDETFAAADEEEAQAVSVSIPTAGHVSARLIRGRPSM
uniref:F-box domain-containing protein n=1 Tax=Leersia perrieri TaxID=77586 RepID=A0A0D9WI54_9ORYZ